MVKIVINTDYGQQGIGSFRLSDEAVEWLCSERGWKVLTEENINEDDGDIKTIFQWENRRIPTKVEYVIPLSVELRRHPDVVACVETLGKAAFGYFSNLKIVDVPDDVEWELKSCNGIEWIAEKHRVWK